MPWRPIMGRSSEEMPFLLQDLETVAKDEVAKALEEATRDTQKGAYHKIRHAGDLLKRIDREMVQKRCRHSARLFESVIELIRKS
jgi:hypothetical protein